MMHLAILGGSFLEPDPLNWLFGAGLGTNIGASLIWGFIAGFIGTLVAKRVRRAWQHLHHRIDTLHDRHSEHAEALAAIAEHVERLSTQA